MTVKFQLTDSIKCKLRYVCKTYIHMKDVENYVNDTYVVIAKQKSYQLTRKRYCRLIHFYVKYLKKLYVKYYKEIL